MSDKTDATEQDRIVITGNTIITGSPDNPPETVQVFGLTYRREADYSDDPAVKLLTRVNGVCKASGKGYHWAIWAITYLDSITHNRIKDDAIQLPSLHL